MDVCVAIVISLCEMNIYTRPTALEKKLAEMKKRAAEEVSKLRREMGSVGGVVGEKAVESSS
jgi:hypothetical protein